MGYSEILLIRQPGFWMPFGNLKEKEEVLKDIERSSVVDTFALLDPVGIFSSYL